MNRKTARENAFILLFEGASKCDETPEEIFDKAVNTRELECDDYVKKVFFGVSENQRMIAEYIEKSLVGWKSSRLSIVSNPPDSGGRQTLMVTGNLWHLFFFKSLLN